MFALNRDRGFMFILTLLILGLMYLVALWALAVRGSEYEQAARFERAAKALAAAEAGLEDFRVKLNKDLHFPPVGLEGQDEFSYTETLFDAHGHSVGRYTVTIDTSAAGEPYGVVKVLSVGEVGPPGREPSRRKLYTEWDILPSRSPRYRKLFRQDQGAL